MPSYKTLVKQIDIQLAESQIAQHQAELLAMKFKATSDDMQGLAIELVQLLHLIITATEVKQAPGIYFLLSKAGKTVYVGQSENVLFRMAGHKEKDFHSVRMIYVPRSSERDFLEQRFIHILKPVINIALTGYNNTHELLNSKICQ